MQGLDNKNRDNSVQLDSEKKSEEADPFGSPRAAGKAADQLA